MKLTAPAFAGASALLLAGLPALAVPDAGLPGEVDETIRLRIEHGYSVGIVIGIVNVDGVQYYGYGRTELGGDQTPDEHTVFEIGSITKVFTALLLADMAQRGEIALDDPIEKYLPQHVRAPTRNGQSITLAHLATHTSGLPRTPDNFAPADVDNPFADYTVERLYDFLSKHELRRDVGAKGEYSNLGFGLLGHLLALRSGMTYEQLVAERITNQLGMLDTRVTLTDDTKRRLAPGHRGVVRAANWDFQAFAGAGALRSTARDMLVFLAANLGLKGNRLHAAMKTTHERRHGNQGLGWVISGDPRIVSHGGTTYGYHSFAGFVTETRTGVVVLSNSVHHIRDIGDHLLDPSVPLHDIAAPVEVGKVALEACVGKYRLGQGVADIGFQHGRLTFRRPGHRRVTLYPASETEFVTRPRGLRQRSDGDERITFLKDEQGKVTALIKDPTWKRLPEVDRAVLESYEGKYRLNLRKVVDIRLQNGQLTTQLTGQRRYPIYPASQTTFFLTVVDAQITFVRNEQGEVTALILHQHGRDQRAGRIED